MANKRNLFKKKSSSKPIIPYDESGKGPRTVKFEKLFRKELEEKKKIIKSIKRKISNQ